AGRGPVAAQAFELALEPPSAGLVIGVSHEGGTTATIAAMEAARRAGARTALITASAGAPAADAADVIVATVELDRGFGHTVGYVSPIVAAAVIAGELGGARPSAEALGARVLAGIDAAHATNGDGQRPDEAIAKTVAGAAHLLVVGTGADRVTARELVLKVDEAPALPSARRALATVRHR